MADKKPKPAVVTGKVFGKTNSTSQKPEVWKFDAKGNPISTPK